MDSTCSYELPEVCVLIVCRCPWVIDFLWAKEHSPPLPPLAALQIKKEKGGGAGKYSLLELVKLFV